MKRKCTTHSIKLIHQKCGDNLRINVNLMHTFFSHIENCHCNVMFFVWCCSYNDFNLLLCYWQISTEPIFSLTEDVGKKKTKWMRQRYPLLLLHTQKRSDEEYDIYIPYILLEKDIQMKFFGGLTIHQHMFNVYHEYGSDTCFKVEFIYFVIMIEIINIIIGLQPKDEDRIWFVCVRLLWITNCFSLTPASKIVKRKHHLIDWCEREMSVHHFHTRGTNISSPDFDQNILQMLLWSMVCGCCIANCE